MAARCRAALCLAACGGADTETADVETTDVADVRTAEVQTNDVQATDTVADMDDSADMAMADASASMNGVAEFTRADYMQACTAEGSVLTETQCECTLDFYTDNGMSISDMNDQAKMTAFMQDLPMEKMSEMSACMM